MSRARNSAVNVQCQRVLTLMTRAALSPSLCSWRGKCTPSWAMISITKVSLIRFGSVTHAFDQAQRFVPLSFSQALGGLSIEIPASRRAAPLGPYLLFLVNKLGVPSTGQIIRLQ